MATNTKAIGTHEVIHLDWKTVREWAKVTFTKDRMAEGALCATTVSLVGVVVLSLHKAMENYIIWGF